MTGTSQHGFHPDAECLSAFAERALGESERGAVLAHLAVCGRCRQVVALAREAADAGAARTSATPRKTTEPNTWWRQWRLVWVPTAIVAAFAVASISAYIRLADQHDSEFKISTQRPTQGATPASSPSPTEQAETRTPSPPLPAEPPARLAKRAHSTGAEPPPAQVPPNATAQMPPPPGATHPVEAVREAPLPEAFVRQAPSDLTAGNSGESFAPPAAGAWDMEQKRAEAQRQAQANTSRMRILAARHAPAEDGGNRPATPAASQTVTVSAAQPMVTATDGIAQPAPRLAVNSLWKASTPIKDIHLPSGLAVVSITRTGPLVLAIDKDGTVFLSDNEGDTWERVKTQWTGRAVEVTQQIAAATGARPAPAAQTETAPNAQGAAGGASSHFAIFELLNDQGQTWVSTDGRTWTSK